MELIEGIKARKSIRAYKPDPVPRDVVVKLMEVATRAPSGVNLQPWEFYVVMGNELEKIKEANVEQVHAGIPPHPEVPIGSDGDKAPKLKGVYRDRQIGVAVQIFQAMGIAKGDTKAMKDWNDKMMRVYDAPAAIIVVVDKMLEGTWPMLDVGSVTQTIALAAQEFGLGTCIMRAIVDYPEQIREILDLPDSKRLIVGLSLGYPDWDHPSNKITTEREDLEKIVTFKGC
ncbi:MAG: nitroreductase [Desulfatiglans sp.]|nr:nitroreductase [Thermodesulfobacteriota bacterium]MEE4352066.1 nitroreductase [Desulfatiglans sp.]